MDPSSHDHQNPQLSQLLDRINQIKSEATLEAQQAIAASEGGGRDCQVAQATIVSAEEGAEIAEAAIVEASEMDGEASEGQDEATNEENETSAESESQQQTEGERKSASPTPPGLAGSKPNPFAEKPIEGFYPQEPRSFAEAKLTDAEVEGLILKYLLAKGQASGREISDQVKLPYMLIDNLLRQMKNEQLVGYTGAAAANDYICRLGDVGRERAKRLTEFSTYFGAAPVDLRDYVKCVSAQSLEKQHPQRKDLERAFSDLLLNQRMFGKLGPAVNSGRGLFLFGFPGNGKTSIAERITRTFGRHIWIPRALGVDGEIIRLFDPVNHVLAPLPKQEGYINNIAIDQRWVRIERPTIVVGGELQMQHLEVQFNPNIGISEAPVQLKSNCGTLVIDDFGRQRMSVDELLNRWIVPLEMRYDFLNTISGKKIQVPFDQLIVFSTNLEPKDLVDDAFLRRIPYKIEVQNPTEVEFRQLFAIMCDKVGFKHDQEAVDYLIEEHYKKHERPFRNCHPRDLLQQIKNQCLYEDRPMKLTKDAFDFAVDNYFSVV